MPGVLLEEQPPQAAPPDIKQPEYGFAVSHQKVELDIDFATQSLTGLVDITILPQTRDLHTVRIDARQCSIAKGKVLVNGVAADFEYEDPMSALAIPSNWLWGAEQYDQQRDRLKPLTEDERGNGRLVIAVPKSVRVEDIDPFSESAATAVLQKGLMNGHRSSGLDGPLSATPVQTPRTAGEQTGRFQPMDIRIQFFTKHSRDGLHFVGLNEGDARFPYLYTRHSLKPGTASCIFPCIDDPAMRCTWDITIKCSRMLGDALKRKPRPKGGFVEGRTKGVKYPLKAADWAAGADEYEIPLSDKEKILEMVVVCSGELMSETVDLDDSSKKVISFQCSTVVAPQHIGFAIGPFEQVDLTDFRKEEENEKLGQGQALAFSGYCLPGRTDELRDTCGPLMEAVDWFSLQYGAFPFTQYSVVFVDDQIRDTEHVASVSLCSTRLLVSQDIIDPAKDNIRILIQAAATQWFGVGIVPAEPCDSWITIGIAHFMAGLFMKMMMIGRNEYLFRQKTLSDRLVEQDIDRPSIYSLGEILYLGEYEYEFMALKAPLVLFILDQRILKASGGGTAGITRVISKIVIGANTGGAADSVLETQAFRRVVDKITKYRSLEAFWNQWVLGAGCPRFAVSQKFNKKRSLVDVTIHQKQDTLPAQRKLRKEAFPRELKEDLHGVYAAEMQPLFTGPMTIRIHEADGTPYEHTVEINEGLAKFEIPYNTKYKRLKRTKHQKERLNNAVVADHDGSIDHLPNSLGNVLYSTEEMNEWGLFDWEEDTQRAMEGEHYEWLRIDTDFEWLCEKTLNIPAYMYVSQLQQDQSVVAHQEAMVFMKTQPTHPLVATFLIRTIMDKKYYYGVRVMAAEILKDHALQNRDWIGMKQLQKAYETLACYRDTKMPLPNNFADWAEYFVECAIPRAMSQIRDFQGKCPKEARHSVLDMLRFNDNSNNEYSDCFKVANLLSCLATSLIPAKDSAAQNDLNFHDDDEEDEEPRKFKEQVIEELERHRRMDEWIHSYHNIYTTTVLDCKQKLMKAKIIPTEPLDFAQYLHDGTLDLVRIKAFEALVDLGFLSNNSVARLLLNVLTTDASPYVRSHLFEVFCMGLATIAFGEDKPIEPVAAVPDADGGDLPMGGEPLLIVQDASTDTRKAQIARTTSIEGALAALKQELKDNEALEAALWKAINSDVIGVSEQRDLLDICSVLYDAVESMIVKARLPRYWKAEKNGKGQLVFKETKKIRTKPRVPKGPKALVPGVPIVPQPPLKLNFGGAASRTSSINIDNTMKPPPKRPVPERTPSSEGSPAKKIKASEVTESQPKSKLLTLKVDPARLNTILSTPPKPVKAGSARPSPAVQASPAYSSAPPSTISVSPSPTLKAGRKPLPDSSSANTRTPLPGASPATPRTPLPETSSSGRKPLPGSAPAPSPSPASAPAAPPKLKLKFSMKPKTPTVSSEQPPPST